jgi:hypothetical protein
MNSHSLLRHGVLVSYVMSLEFEVVQPFLDNVRKHF